MMSNLLEVTGIIVSFMAVIIALYYLEDWLIRKNKGRKEDYCKRCGKTIDKYNDLKACFDACSESEYQLRTVDVPLWRGRYGEAQKEIEDLKRRIDILEQKESDD